MKLFTAISSFIFALTFMIAIPAFSQMCFDFSLTTDRAKEVKQDSEFIKNGAGPAGIFCNPLRIDGKPLNYDEFSLGSQGELSLTKELFVTGQATLIPFSVYLRRDGKLIKLPGEDISKQIYLKIDLAPIMRLAKPGDQLIIEPANKEDWQAKRILKLLEGGC